MRRDSGHTGCCAAGKDGAVGPCDYLNTRFDFNTLVPKMSLIMHGRQGQVRFWKHIWEGMEESPSGRLDSGKPNAGARHGGDPGCKVPVQGEGLVIAPSP